MQIRKRGNKVKGFLKNHSYDMVTMLLNQLVLSMFGFCLVLAAMRINNDTLRNLTSIFSTLFYLLLLYMKAWDIGFGDKVSVEQGKKSNLPYRGVLISHCRQNQAKSKHRENQLIEQHSYHIVRMIF